MEALIQATQRALPARIYLIDIVPPGEFPWRGGVGCQGCGAEPQYEVLAHMLDCENPDVAAQLDADGNFVWYGCHACYGAWRRGLTDIIGRLDRYLPIECEGCGHPVGSVDDILLRVRRI